YGLSQPRERCVPRPPGRGATPVPDGGSRSVRPSLTTSAARATCAPIMRKCTARAGGVLGAACGLLCDSCGQAELAGRDTDHTLEVLGELALIREADAHRDLREGEVSVGMQKLLRPRHAARNDVLVRRHASGRFELPREVVGAAV